MTLRKSKKFHRVLFRPAFAVQARELTQSQTILQNQIEKFGDHMFKQGSIVIPGGVAFDNKYYAVKLTSIASSNTLAQFTTGTVITGGTSGVVAEIVGTDALVSSDPAYSLCKILQRQDTNNTSARIHRWRNNYRYPTVIVYAVSCVCQYNCYRFCCDW